MSPRNYLIISGTVFGIVAMLCGVSLMWAT